ncbi:MAG: DUF2608 domain-containing protein [Alphaproteobacteria bacterium]|nr:DUF2608 domain-containing protein [Alphaproteobacteria bacterium]
MKITFDLDDVIFNMKPLFHEAFNKAGIPYKKNTNWNIAEIYDENVCQNLIDLWSSDALYRMPVLDPGIPYILNSLMKRSDMEILFVTERRLKQPEKTFMQLRNAGINCSYNQVYDQEGLKSDILRDIRPDVHFDDSPLVIQGCLLKDVPVIMISNNSTLYNHYLRGQLKHYTNLRTALFKEGIYSPNSIKR